MRVRDHRAILSVGAAILFAASGAAQGAIILGNGDTANLAAVLAPGSDRQVCIDDKIFTFESYTSSQFDPALFTIIGFISQTPNQFGHFNVGFDLSGPFGDGSPGDMIVHEMNLQYTVCVKPESYAQGVRLCDARLTFNGQSGGDGSLARVDETIFDLDANQLLGQLSVFDTAGPPRDTRLSDAADYCQIYNTSGYRCFEVNKDIKMFAAHVNDFATASFIRQEFSQIPTPGASPLLALGGLLALRRRR